MSHIHRRYHNVSRVLRFFGKTITFTKYSLIEFGLKGLMLWGIIMVWSVFLTRQFLLQHMWFKVFVSSLVSGWALFCVYVNVAFVRGHEWARRFHQIVYFYSGIITFMGALGVYFNIQALTVHVSWLLAPPFSPKFVQTVLFVFSGIFFFLAWDLGSEDTKKCFQTEPTSNRDALPQNTSNPPPH